MRVLELSATALVVVACSSSPVRLPPPPELPSGVTGEVVIDSYPVRGRSVEDIGESMEQNGPIWAGRRVYGLARWRFSWGWRTVQEEGACRLVDVRVAVRVEIEMPQWIDWSRGSRALQARWETFETALLLHEDGHRDAGYRAAADIFQVLRSVRAPDCVRLAPVAKEQARAVIQRHQRVNERYERATSWGGIQGAVWPPSA